MKQTGGGKNVYLRQTKIGVDRVIVRLGDNLRMTDGLGTVLIGPGVQRRDVHITYLLTLFSLRMQGHSTGTAPKKGIAGFQRPGPDQTSARIVGQSRP